MAALLPRATLTMLGKLIPRLGSNHAGEVIATVEAIKRTLAGSGADLHDLCVGLGAASKAAQWRDEVKLCRRYWEALTIREQGLIESLEGWRGRPTEKQLAWLSKIVERLSK